ncbi:MAG: RDD family protein [Myxococcales bacterium]|nr:RDD family protein [Myxococcales bacterium]
MTEVLANSLPEGARCAAHPETLAGSLCARCGSYACQACSHEVAGQSFCGACVSTLPVKSTPGRRLGAAIIDSILVTVPMYTAAMAAVLSEELGGLEVVLMVVGGLTTVAVLGLNLRGVHTRGQSIGKRLMKMKVVRADGSRASTPRIIFARNGVPMLIGVVPILGGFFGLVDSLWIFGNETRCVHDLIADTIVVEAPEG